jgi:hypothetical protein
MGGMGRRRNREDKSGGQSRQSNRASKHLDHLEPPWVGGSSRDRHGPGARKRTLPALSKEKTRAKRGARASLSPPTRYGKLQRQQVKKAESPQIRTTTSVLQNQSPLPPVLLTPLVRAPSWSKCRPIVIKCPQDSPKNGSKFLKGPQRPGLLEGNSRSRGAFWALFGESYNDSSTLIDWLKDGRSRRELRNRRGRGGVPRRTYPLRGSGGNSGEQVGESRRGGDEGPKPSSSSSRSRGSTSAPEP